MDVEEKNNAGDRLTWFWTRKCIMSDCIIALENEMMVYDTVTHLDSSCAVRMVNR